MLFLRNLVFAIAFYAVSITLSLGIYAVSLMTPHRVRDGASNWSRQVMRLSEGILGIRLEIEGDLPTKACIVAPKHESYFEALLLPALFPTSAVVMKRELSRIPVWGRLVKKHGSIFVDRKGRSAAMRTMLTRAKAAKSEGRPIVIFPEGSRAQTGEQPPVRSGVAGLYRLLGLPVVPIALATNHVWPRTGMKRPGTAIMRVMPEIPPGLPREEMEARLHAAINEPLSRG
ncbi:MAG: lysophospholipid acyltransferase family protein [Pacificimonas sp.]|jgi:1-acyl-sn-glycerol-3-phosphate acyltransferase|nr:lysophospholipid acyltransferase family protein [Pacificimonas sp.]